MRSTFSKEKFNIFEFRVKLIALQNIIKIEMKMVLALIPFTNEC